MPDFPDIPSIEPQDFVGQGFSTLPSKASRTIKVTLPVPPDMIGVDHGETPSLLATLMMEGAETVSTIAPVVQPRTENEYNTMIELIKSML